VSPDDAVTVTDGQLIEVVAGHPTPEELAALVIALSVTTGATTADGPPEPARGWSDRGHGLRRSLRPGPHAWTLSGRRSAE
jgi:hypothetical protein